MPPEQRKPCDQREADQSGDDPHSRERADAWRADPPAWGGGGGQEQCKPSDLHAGGAGEAEEGAEHHSAGEEDHRGLGANVQGRDGAGEPGSSSTPPPCCPAPLCLCFCPSSSSNL